MQSWRHHVALQNISGHYEHCGQREPITTVHFFNVCIQHIFLPFVAASANSFTLLHLSFWRGIAIISDVNRLRRLARRERLCMWRHVIVVAPQHPNGSFKVLWLLNLQLSRTPENYSEDSLGTVEHEELRRSIINFYRKTYISHTKFESRLKNAVLVRVLWSLSAVRTYDMSVWTCSFCCLLRNCNISCRLEHERTSKRLQ